MSKYSISLLSIDQVKWKAYKWGNLFLVCQFIKIDVGKITVIWLDASYDGIMFTKCHTKKKALFTSFW
jgi:hypothetical protein